MAEPEPAEPAGAEDIARREDPTPLRFHDVLVSPFSDLLDYSTGGHLHRGGPHWPDWESQTAARHCRKGVPIDSEPLPAAAEERMDGPLAWGGALVWHFGHQLSDFSMRLVPTLTAVPEARIAFAAEPEPWAAAYDAPPFFHEILEWVGLPRERFVRIDRPTLAADLFVLPQAEQHYGPGPSAAHLDRMDELAERRLPGRRAASGTVFVSRAGMPARLAGEGYLERLVAESGLTVMRPETLPLATQLETYATAGELIFTQGSAVHGARLLGRSLGDVIVINRLPGGDRIAEAALAPRARSLDYRDAVIGVVCGLQEPGIPFVVMGMPVVDADALLGLLGDVVPGLRQRWDDEAYREVRDADVLEWFGWSVAHPWLDGPGSWEHMLDTLEANGLSHLRGTVERLIGEERAKRESDPASPSAPASTETTPAAAPSVAEEPAPDAPGSPHLADSLNRLARSLRARSYLEIGDGSGQTLAHMDVPSRILVGRPVIVDLSVQTRAGVTVVWRSSDEYFAGLPAEATFDLIHIDGGRSFEQAYRDIVNVLLHTHPRSVVALSHTLPREMSENQSDAFRVVLAVHDHHPALEYGTIAEGDGATLFWRASADRRTPSIGSLEAISRLTVADLRQHMAFLRASSAEEVVTRCLSDLWDAGV